jgi:hypothetical protein
MRKELVWAAGIGIFFGLVIAFGAWRINSSLKTKSTIPTPTPNSQNITTASITLDKPENDSVVTTTPVTVSGITKPLTWLVFSGEKGDYITQSDETGVFSQDVDLAAGTNQIEVTSLDNQGNQAMQKVMVVYSSSFQLNLGASPTPASATSESDINEAVAQKVAEASKNPKAYIGTVTDIADSTIQIKTIDSQIQQVDIGGGGITVVNVAGKNNKTVKLTDIAIGDFTIAMGYVNGSQVLNAQRILITDPVTEPKISVSLSSVTTVSKKSLTVTDIKSGQSGTITPDKNTDLESFANGKETATKIASVNKNDLVIYVSDTTGTPAVVRSVFDIGPSKS